MIACILYAVFLHIHKGRLEASTVIVSDTQGWKTFYIYAGPEKIHSISSFKSHSQVQQDTVIHTMFPQSGYFVDLAANDWQKLSNTYSLERYGGWNGLCIEPNSIYWEGYLNRRCTMVSAVISNSNDDLIQFAIGEGVFGGIIAPDMDNAKKRAKEKFRIRNEVKKFYTVNISNIFEKFAVPSTIQYISLDVEGAEERIVESFPFGMYTVLAFTIERPSKKVLEILEYENFVEVGVLGHFGDTMYLNKKVPDFQEVLKKGQIEITKIEKKINEVRKEDISPVRNMRTSRAQGARCPYYMGDACQKPLLHYDANYEIVMERLGKYAR